MSFTELFANAFQTLVASPIGASDTQINVQSIAPSTLQGGQFRIIIDSEYMMVTAGQNSTLWTVTRGIEGTTPTTHLANAVVEHCLTAGAVEGLLQLNSPMGFSVQAYASGSPFAAGPVTTTIAGGVLTEAQTPFSTIDEMTYDSQGRLSTFRETITSSGAQETHTISYDPSTGLLAGVS